MWKYLLKSIREYKKPSILAPIYVTIEVMIECAIPFITALLVNQIKAGCGLSVILKYGLLLLVLAGLSLNFGRLSGTSAALAASGFSRNLRKDLFNGIQSFSFENIDRFSSSSLVTRLTTDVSNVQMAYMMIIRVAIRSPLMLIFAVIMSFIMGGKLALVFVVVIPMLGIGLYVVIKKAFPIFRRVFRQYDALNRSIQENVQGIRVVEVLRPRGLREAEVRFRRGKPARGIHQGGKNSRVQRAHDAVLPVHQHGVHPHIWRVYHRDDAGAQLQRRPAFLADGLQLPNAHEPDDALNGVRHDHHRGGIRAPHRRGALRIQYAFQSRTSGLRSAKRFHRV